MLQVCANLAVAFVALSHVAFFVLETFLWTKPVGRRVFGLSREHMEATASLAANQGVYNGFLAAGLIWGLVADASGLEIKLFFLSCVIVAGVVGAVTAKGSILFVQAVPAAIALLLVILAR